MPKLFKLFGFLESSKQINTKGIGLGLHITKKIVKMFNGDIICNSKEGIGSNFIFIVPLSNNEIILVDDKLRNHRIINPIEKPYSKLII